MIRERFAFAGKWEYAWLGQTWLGIEDMEAVWENDEILSQIKTRKDNWEDGAPWTYREDELSLFGIDQVEFEESYLVWRDDGGAEPALYIYTSQRESRFENLFEFLRYAT